MPLVYLQLLAFDFLIQKTVVGRRSTTGYQSNMKKQIPNLFTLINLIFGCIALVMALQTDNINIYTNDDFTSSFNVPEKLAFASLFIFAAAAIDFLDGFVARLFQTSSEMGKQLDSLADVVSFGVCPSVILYQLLRLSFIKEENGLDVAFAWLLPAFILAGAAAYRLAKFNLDPSQHYGFKGVPTPAVGLLVASFPLILHYGSFSFISEIMINKWFLYGLIITLSWLMVSNLPLIALKFSGFSIKHDFPKLILMGIGIVAVLFLKWLAVPIIFVAYILISLTFKNKATT